MAWILLLVSCGAVFIGHPVSQPASQAQWGHIQMGAHDKWLQERLLVVGGLGVRPQVNRLLAIRRAIPALGRIRSYLVLSPLRAFVFLPTGPRGGFLHGMWPPWASEWFHKIPNATWNCARGWQLQRNITTIIALLNCLLFTPTFHANLDLACVSGVTSENVCTLPSH